MASAKPKRELRLWSENKLQEAVKAIQMGMALCRASEFYGILKSTLSDKVSGHTPLSRKKGPEPVLSRELEDRIEKWLIMMARIGYGQTKNDILNKVQELVKKMGIPTPFPDAQPSDKWYHLFMWHHPDLQMHMLSCLSREHCEVLFDNIHGWFTEFESYLKNMNNEDILEDPTRIYNCDETGFPLAPKSGKVIAHRSDKHIYQGGTLSNKMQIMIPIGTSASGHYIKPLVVYPGVQPHTQLWEDFHNKFPSGLFSNSSNGWVDGTLFQYWLEFEFNKEITKHNVRRPVLLLIDGARCHISESILCIV